MGAPFKPDIELELRLSRRLLDVYIRLGFVLALVVLCYWIFAPFIALMAWSVIMAVSLYPAHRSLSRRLGGRPGLAATLLVVVGLILIVAPVTVLLVELGDSVHLFVTKLSGANLHIPAPPPQVAEWPLIGKTVNTLWMKAHADLPSLLTTLQPKIGDLSLKALGSVAAIGGAVLLFLAAFVIAGIIMTFGQPAERNSLAIFDRVFAGRGARFATLSTATVRAVAQGVLGVALIQAIVMGLLLMFAGIPFAGVLAAIVLVLAIAQLPVALVSIPVIAWIWTKGDYSTGAAILHTLLLGLAGVVDNILKPLLLGRGVDAPMPVILLGALGGMASGGILGMFVGATLLALGHQIFMEWVANNPDAEPAAIDVQPVAAPGDGA
jgi:predicted PurR-regulated permease PerM